MRTITTLSRQSLSDIALMACGSIEVLPEIAKLNDISITDDVLAGTELIVPSVVKESYTNWYSVNKTFPATQITNEDSPVQFGGIDYMGIEIDFKVS